MLSLFLSHHSHSFPYELHTMMTSKWAHGHFPAFVAHNSKPLQRKTNNTNRKLSFIQFVSAKSLWNKLSKLFSLDKLLLTPCKFATLQMNALQFRSFTFLFSSSYLPFQSIGFSFQFGQSLSYTHSLNLCIPSLTLQVINRRKSSNPYITRGILKFRLLQILLNALALLIIAGKF